MSVTLGHVLASGYGRTFPEGTRMATEAEKGLLRLAEATKFVFGFKDHNLMADGFSVEDRLRKWEAEEAAKYPR